MSDTFADFAEAASRPAGAGTAVAPPQFDRVAVLGGGTDARLFAALCLSEGAEVTLFSAYGVELEALRSTSGIALRDAGPVRDYARLTREAEAEIGQGGRPWEDVEKI